MRAPSFLDPVIDPFIELVEGPAQFGIILGLLGDDLGEAGTQDPIIGAGAEQRGAPTLSRHPIAMGPGDPLDQAVQAAAAAGDTSSGPGSCRRGFPQQGSPMVPQIAVGKTPRQQTEHQQRAEQRLHGHVGEAQTAGPLPIDLDRFIDPMERVFADGTVLADPLDVQETSVGLEADPPQGGQVRQPLADAEVARVVDRRLGPQGAGPPCDTA